MSPAEHLDVVVVGAGLSGIGVAHHLQTKLPAKSFALLEAREAIGGTWDLFRYPGVRSDSDMYTLGYAFRPWPSAKAIADGPAILAYIRDTATAYGIDRKVRFGHTVVAASWSSREGRWTLGIERGPERAPVSLTCTFLFACTGYYDYATGHRPALPGMERFAGQLVHPQSWPEDLDYAGKRIVVIGSGATAVTLVPALAESAAHVTMLQRSPSYVVSAPSVDRLAVALGKIAPPRVAYEIVRWRNIVTTAVLYHYIRRRPEAARRRLLARVLKALGPGFDVERHFTPRYKPWDQRICLVPDGDLFAALKSGRADIVTDEIETFTETGLGLRSGGELDADLVVMATGLELKLLGGMPLVVDGRTVDLAATTTYKGSMFSGVPNLATTLGYTNASWTLKCDLTGAYVCRLLAYMDRKGFASCMPVHDESVAQRPLIDFTSGYVQRALPSMPKQGDRTPWRLHQNYLLDLVALRFGALDDGALRFVPRQAVEPAADLDLERASGS